MKITNINTSILGKTLCVVYLGILFIVLFAPIPKPGEGGFLSLTIQTSVDLDFLTHLISLSVWGYLLTFWRFDRVPELVVSIAVAVLLEVAQVLTVHRVFEITDLMANLLGVLFGLKTGIHFRLTYDSRSMGLSSEHIDT